MKKWKKRLLLTKKLFSCHFKVLKEGRKMVFFSTKKKLFFSLFSLLVALNQLDALRAEPKKYLVLPSANYLYNWLA